MASEGGRTQPGLVARRRHFEKSPWGVFQAGGGHKNISKLLNCPFSLLLFSPHLLFRPS